MKKSIKSIITLFLVLNVGTACSPRLVNAISNEDICKNECIQEYGDNSIFVNNMDVLDWYYVSKGKDQIPEGPKESVDFLKENSAYYLGDTSKKVLYLTFDEGYENQNTPGILDVLKELKVPAAFFVTKPFIDKNPELIKQMVAEGHIVGNHGVHHISIAQMHNKIFASEITEVADAYKELMGKDMPKFFRPPEGKYSRKSLKMTKDLGYKTIFWSFAFKDWLKDQLPESYVIEKVLAGAHPGGIMRLHAVSESGTKVLPTIIKNLRLEGYEFKSLNELPAE